jgi:hypothetical protein
MNVPHCYVIHTLAVLLQCSDDFRYCEEVQT